MYDNMTENVKTAAKEIQLSSQDLVHSCSDMFVFKAALSANMTSEHSHYVKTCSLHL